MKLLVHLCCGPCACYPLSQLTKEHDITLLFFNPNIEPLEEYDKRLDSALLVADHFNLKLIEIKDQVLTLNNTGNCLKCYDYRMDKVFEYAQENGFEAVYTTLLISPYQKHQLLIDVCQRNEQLYKVKFFYQDYRVNFYDGQRMAKDLGLYRQKYCGCLFNKDAKSIKEFK